MQIDDSDRRLLRHYLAEPGQSVVLLAERAAMTQATIWRRLERLRQMGVISRPEAVIDWRLLGYEVEVSLRFSLDKTDPRAFDDFIAAARLVRAPLMILSLPPAWFPKSSPSRRSWGVSMCV